ncbi:hypothetical protein GcM1_137008 [Golovinomyces cichoracearum]|uniref:Uncharacterized protein n=1 Tax=Golovinomyces cichoracearum TaxID=62708 RepID=A0A420JBM4_9PEZI|nr:hypothetical protein GcM1_137008 [Golovinomyces cichoracearum]
MDSFIQDYEGRENEHNVHSDNGEQIEQYNNNLEIDTNTLLLELANDTEDNTDKISNYLASTYEISLYHKLCDQSLYHRLTYEDLTSSYVVEGGYTENNFRGIIIDTGAATNSTAGYDQVRAYLREFNGKIYFSTLGAVKAYFGVGGSISIGTISVPTSIREVIFHILNAQTPFLLCLQGMDRLGVYLNNTTNEILRN